MLTSCRIKIWCHKREVVNLERDILEEVNALITIAIMKLQPLILANHYLVKAQIIVDMACAMDHLKNLDNFHSESRNTHQIHRLLTYHINLMR